MKYKKIYIHLGSSVVWMDLPCFPAGGYFPPYSPFGVIIRLLQVYNATYARIASDQKIRKMITVWIPPHLVLSSDYLKTCLQRKKYMAKKEMPFRYKIYMIFPHWMLQHGVWCILLTRKFPCWKLPYDINESKNCEERCTFLVHRRKQEQETRSFNPEYWV